jgi:hypothetical protein
VDGGALGVREKVAVPPVKKERVEVETVMEPGANTSMITLDGEGSTPDHCTSVLEQAAKRTIPCIA